MQRSSGLKQAEQERRGQRKLCGSEQLKRPKTDFVFKGVDERTRKLRPQDSTVWDLFSGACILPLWSIEIDADHYFINTMKQGGTYPSATKDRHWYRENGLDSRHAQLEV